jgi:ribonuclease Z
MFMINVCLLGTAGTMPQPNKYLSALSIAYDGKMILLDCGEGTQVAIKEFHRGLKNIEVICLSHFHGDHVTGIPGLLLTIANSGREEPITIIGPSGLRYILEGLLVIVGSLPYKIRLIEVENESKCVYNVGALEIAATFAEHSIDCLAYSLYFKREKEFLPDEAKKLGIPTKFWSILQKGKEVIYNSSSFTPEMVQGNYRKGIKISYCTDTRPNLELMKFVANSNLLVCDAMYGDDDDYEKAVENKHMLFREAAKLAKDAEVKELWLTHFSPALKEPERYLLKATEIFEASILGKQGMNKEFNFTDNVD